MSHRGGGEGEEGEKEGPSFHLFLRGSLRGTVLGPSDLWMKCLDIVIRGESINLTADPGLQYLQFIDVR